MEASSDDEKRPMVDLIKDKNGTDQVLLQNPKGASVKVILLLILFVSPMLYKKVLSLFSMQDSDFFCLILGISRE